MISHTDNISETRDAQHSKFPSHRMEKKNPLLISCTHRLNSYRNGVRVNQSQTTVTSCCISPPSKNSLIQHKQQQLLCFFPPRHHTPPSPAQALTQKITFLHPSLTKERLLMTSLLLLISCWCGKPWPCPLRPPGGSRSPLPPPPPPLPSSR